MHINIFSIYGNRLSMDILHRTSIDDNNDIIYYHTGRSLQTIIVEAKRYYDSSNTTISRER